MTWEGQEGREGREGKGKEGRKGEGKEKVEISPPQSFLKVGAYGEYSSLMAWLSVLNTAVGESL